MILLTVEAASKQNVDQTYFKGSMEFRGRCALLLEAALRTAVACRNYPLTKTVVETVAMFKIGTTSPDKVDWFNGVMQKQYQTLPRLNIDNTFIECPDEKEMATSDVLVIGMDMTRLHAEAFTRQKVAMFQKQGIPPQVALQTYREGWWFLARAERLDGDAPGSEVELRTDGILKDVSKDDLKKFEGATFGERLLTAWPMMIQNVAQKSGKVKIQCQAPPVPGKYKFTVSLKSQDFLGADQEFSVEGTIVDASTVVRKPKEDKEQDLEFSRRVNEADVINYVDGRSYVDFVKSLEVYHKPPKAEFNPTKEAVPTTSRSVLTSVPDIQHRVIAYTEKK